MPRTRRFSEADALAWLARQQRRGRRLLIAVDAVGYHVRETRLAHPSATTGETLYYARPVGSGPTFARAIKAARKTLRWR